MSDETMDDLIESEEIEIEDTEEEPAQGDDDEKGTEPEETVESLKQKVEALSKEKDGMYREMVTERKTRQELKSQIDQIKGMMEEARANREQMASQAAQQAAEVTTKSGIPVKFDENGDAYVAQEDVAGLASAELAEVKKELAAIKNQNFQNTTVSQNQRILSDVISSNEGYAGAYAQVQKAYAWLDNKSEDVLHRYGLDVSTTSLDEVMGLLERDFGNDFSAQFPGFDIDTVVEACTVGTNGMFRPRKIKKALDSVLANSPEEEKENQNRKNLKFLGQKPNNLSGQRNQKGSTGRTLDDIANLTMDDFENMSDADLKRVERAMAKADL